MIRKCEDCGISYACFPQDINHPEIVDFTCPNCQARDEVKALKAEMDKQQGLTEGTYTQPLHGWTCFHCGKTFITPKAARYHFGKTPDEVITLRARVKELEGK